MFLNLIYYYLKLELKVRIKSPMSQFVNLPFDLNNIYFKITPHNISHHMINKMLEFENKLINIIS